MPGTDSPDNNRLVGRLVQLSGEGGKIRVMVDAGLPLNVLVPEERFRAMGLTVGDWVCVNCPLEAVSLL